MVDDVVFIPFMYGWVPCFVHVLLVFFDVGLFDFFDGQALRPGWVGIYCALFPDSVYYVSSSCILFLMAFFCLLLCFCVFGLSVEMSC